ncbi:MAG: O-antigen ligase family protein [Rhizobiaceae bacterium]|nr:O-antigen ligase family protein [Rhizobiaceae bacterium]
MKKTIELLADIPRVNRIFTLLCFAVPPALGSVVSFLFNGGGLGCLYYALRGKIELAATREVRVLSILFLLFVSANLLAAVVNGSAQSKPAELLALITFALFPFSYAYWSISRKEEIVASAVWGAAIACVSAFIFALVQIALFPRDRVEGGAGNPLVFATVIVVAICVVCCGILLMNTRYRRVLAGAAICGAMALILSQSRSPMAILAVNLVVLFAVFGRMGRLRRLWVPIVAVLLIAGTVISTGVQVPYVSSRFEQISEDWQEITDKGDYSSSSGIRLAIWEIGIDMWKESPWFGHGRRFAAEEMNRRLLADHGIDKSFTHFHNFVLQALVQSGAVGLIGLIAMFGYAAFLAIRTISTSMNHEQRFGAALMLVALLTYAGTGMTNIMFGHDILDAVFMVCMVPGTYLAVGRSMAAQRSSDSS